MTFLTSANGRERQRESAGTASLFIAPKQSTVEQYVAAPALWSNETVTDMLNPSNLVFMADPGPPPTS